MIELNKDNFETEVNKSPIPVFIDFSADWCFPCKSMKPILLQLEKEYEGIVKFCELDTAANMELTIKFGITGLPTFIIFKNGKVQKRFSGSTRKTKMKEFLELNK